MAGKPPRTEGPESDADAVHLSTSLANGQRGTTSLEILPATKVPALDTVDPYAVDRPTADATVHSPVGELIQSSDCATIESQLVQGYAQFISGFTGLEDIAFTISRHPKPTRASQPPRGIICASIPGSPGGELCTIRELPFRLDSKKETQFSLQLDLDAEPENGEQQPEDAVPEAVSVDVPPRK